MFFDDDDDEEEDDEWGGGGVGVSSRFFAITRSTTIVAYQYPIIIIL